jgi:CRP-like cAMP-binding protein
MATSLSMAPDVCQNQLLAAVPPADAERLRSILQPVRLARGDVLVNAGQPQQDVYFPAGCLISVFVQLTERHGAEVGLVGSEGFVGLPVLLETDPGPHVLVCQVGGQALRMPVRSFRAAMRREGGFRRLLLRYAGVRLVEQAQLLACLALHTVTPRLARWLLMTYDRTGSDHVHLTQDFLARMLAVGRPYLNGAMQGLQRQGYIAYQRGRIAVLNRAGLEAAACEDYHRLRAAYERVFGPARNGSLAARGVAPSNVPRQPPASSARPGG